MIYLDNNATTRPADEVREAMLPYLGEWFANPSSPYGPARRVARAVYEAREGWGSLVGAEPGEVVFTSGGTESNHAAVSMALALRPGRTRIVVSAVEHASMLSLVRALSVRGFEVVEVSVDGSGRMDSGSLRDAVDERTALVSIMTANNETGVLNSIHEAVAAAAEHGALVHSDAVQAAGKIPLEFRESGLDLMSLSSHKLHGPKGLGVLCVRKGLAPVPWMQGGQQEGGRRGGTENVPGIVGSGVAAALAAEALPGMDTRVRPLRDRLEQGILSQLHGVSVLGAGAPRLPNTAALLIEGIEAEALIARLDMQGICCSSGSACAAGSPEPSHVLSAMGIPPHLAQSAIRLSLSRYTSQQEIDSVLHLLPPAIQSLRDAGPLYNDRPAKDPQ